MKKVLFISIYVLGIVCLSSCRSTSSSCGLADAKINQTKIQQGKFC
ncbi:hypothetical protein [Polaribacter sp.]